MSLDNYILAFLELIRAGLWGKEACLAQYGDIDYSKLFQTATEQSVVGLVAAGLGHVNDMKTPQEWVLQFAGQALQIEQRNKAMNLFVADLIEKLCENDVYALLVKGQGVAQCYEKPLWRSSGDVDLLLNDTNFEKARQLLVPLATSVEEENNYRKHLGMVINGWDVELHGNLRSELSGKTDRGLDEITKDVFNGGNVRSWMNGKTQVFLMGVNNDVLYVFSHILQHFFRGGIGLRQICDWCRLLWTYRDSLNHELLESRIRQMGLMTEWKVFASFSVEYLGMPLDSMPLFSKNDNQNAKLKLKASRVMNMILEAGNFGHNHEESYRQKYKGFKKRAISVWRYTQEGLQHFRIFPMDSLRVWYRIMRIGFKVALRG